MWGPCKAEGPSAFAASPPCLPAISFKDVSAPAFLHRCHLALALNCARAPFLTTLLWVSRGPCVRAGACCMVLPSMAVPAGPRRGRRMVLADTFADPGRSTCFEQPPHRSLAASKHDACDARKRIWLSEILFLRMPQQRCIRPRAVAVSCAFVRAECMPPPLQSSNSTAKQLSQPTGSYVWGYRSTTGTYHENSCCSLAMLNLCL